MPHCTVAGPHHNSRVAASAPARCQWRLPYLSDQPLRAAHTRPSRRDTCAACSSRAGGELLYVAMTSRPFAPSGTAIVLNQNGRHYLPPLGCVSHRRTQVRPRTASVCCELPSSTIGQGVRWLNGRSCRAWSYNGVCEAIAIPRRTHDRRRHAPGGDQRAHSHASNGRRAVLMMRSYTAMLPWGAPAKGQGVQLCGPGILCCGPAVQVCAVVVAPL